MTKSNLEKSTPSSFKEGKKGKQRRKHDFINRVHAKDANRVIESAEDETARGEIAELLKTYPPLSLFAV